jgi:thiamine-phosphate pyrophosphorylase
MNWKKKCLQNFKLYAITDLKKYEPDIVGRIAQALKGGADIVQLRSKNLSDHVLVRLGQKIRRITTRYHKLYIVNDRIDIMLATAADGVHLGQDDIPIEVARKMMYAQEKIIGLSTHSVVQAKQAAARGADYIGFGPIFSTPTKPDYRPVGIGTIRLIVKTIQVPWVCVGGINRSNLKAVLNSGARRVAVVREIFSASSSFQAAKNMKNIIASHNSID